MRIVANTVVSATGAASAATNLKIRSDADVTNSPLNNYFLNDNPYFLNIYLAARG
jgi:hypothetical protein